jgi:hypothetical protein
MKAGAGGNNKAPPAKMKSSRRSAEALSKIVAKYVRHEGNPLSDGNTEPEMFKIMAEWILSGFLQLIHALADGSDALAFEQIRFGPLVPQTYTQ